jgi:aspartate-semialdehyde dehydrogenase
MAKVAVGVLGATGAVGQRFVQLLADHPWFEVVELAASDRSAGKPYKDACTWRLGTPLPESAAARVVKTCDEKFEAKILFSGLDSSVAGEVETALANKGHAVVSNSRNHRMDPDVPLLIPEVNADHLDALAAERTGGGYIRREPELQRSAWPWPWLPRSGRSTHRSRGGCKALSGAGYPASPPWTSTTYPHIGGGEEEKIETEPLRILGSFAGGAFAHAPFRISASVHRVAVTDGHTMAVFARLKSKATAQQAVEAIASFRGEPQERKLPTAPRRPIHVLPQENRPQPRLDRDLEGGMAVSVGRVRADTLFDLKFEVLVHNTIRGAAGAAILNAELLKARDLLP